MLYGSDEFCRAQNEVPNNKICYMEDYLYLQRRQEKERKRLEAEEQARIEARREEERRFAT